MLLSIFFILSFYLCSMQIIWKLVCISIFTQLFSISEDHFYFSFIVAGQGYINLKQTNKNAMGVTIVGMVVENIKTHHNQTFHLVVGRIMATPKMSMF